MASTSTLSLSTIILSILDGFEGTLPQWQVFKKLERALWVGHCSHERLSSHSYNLAVDRLLADGKVRVVPSGWPEETALQLV